MSKFYFSRDIFNDIIKNMDMPDGSLELEKFIEESIIQAISERDKLLSKACGALEEAIHICGNGRIGHMPERIYTPQIRVETVDRWREKVAKIKEIGG